MGRICLHHNKKRVYQTSKVVKSLCEREKKLKEQKRRGIWAIAPSEKQDKLFIVFDSKSDFKGFQSDGTSFFWE